MSISTGALRVVGPPAVRPAGPTRAHFLPPPPAGRATSRPTTTPARTSHFYPRPPRGGRPGSTPGPLSRGGFLSTPSARRATHIIQIVDMLDIISIHALREEGDPPAAAPVSSMSDFYPRPPRGGRPENFPHGGRSCWISIHALREEGDVDTGFLRAAQTHFYPRPPRGGRRRCM